MGMYYMEVQDQLWLFYAMRFGAGAAVVLGAILFIYSSAIIRRERPAAQAALQPGE